jgi:hypothetical protein
MVLGFSFFARHNSANLCIDADMLIPMRPATAKLRYVPVRPLLMFIGSSSYAWNWVKPRITVAHSCRSSRPSEFIDAKALSPDLAGVMMPSPDAPVENVREFHYTLEYDEVRPALDNHGNTAY